jgi:hypothetical protein
MENQDFKIFRKLDKTNKKKTRQVITITRGF